MHRKQRQEKGYFEGFMLDLTVYDFICVTDTMRRLSSSVSLSLSLCPCLCPFPIPAPALAQLTCKFGELANFITGAIGFASSQKFLKICRTKVKS